MYLQYISTGSTTVHVVIVWRHLYTLHHPLQLTQIAVSGHNLASLWAQLPDTQSVADEETCWDGGCRVKNHSLSSCDKQVISCVAEGKSVDRPSALHCCLTTTHSLLLPQIPDHNTKPCSQTMPSAYMY